MDPQIGGACPIVAGEEAAAVEVMVVVDVADPQIEGACFIEEAAAVEVMVVVDVVEVEVEVGGTLQRR